MVERQVTKNFQAYYYLSYKPMHTVRSTVFDFDTTAASVEST